MRDIVLPYTRVGIVGGVMLGLGRALGETMAVTFVIGNAHHIKASLLAPGTTISASLANEFTEAVGDLYTSSLIELGFILFVITFIVLAGGEADADAPRAARRPMTDLCLPRRRATNAVILTLSLAATGLGLLILFLILWSLLATACPA